MQSIAELTSKQLTDKQKQDEDNPKVIKSKITPEQLQNFMEVAEIINEQILEKEIFDKNIISNK